METRAACQESLPGGCTSDWFDKVGNSMPGSGNSMYEVTEEETGSSVSFALGPHAWWW